MMACVRETENTVFRRFTSLVDLIKGRQEEEEGIN